MFGEDEFRVVKTRKKEPSTATAVRSNEYDRYEELPEEPIPYK